MENKNEVKDLNESEFEEVSGGLDKNTKSVKLRDDKAMRDVGWGRIAEDDFKCIGCGYRFSSCLPKPCPKCGELCRMCRSDE